MSYMIQVRKMRGGSPTEDWRGPQTGSPKLRNNTMVDRPYLSVIIAVESAKLYQSRIGSSIQVRVINAYGDVEWDSTFDETFPAGERGAKHVATINLPIELEKPLVLDRKKVIGKLQENLKKEKDKREEAEKKEADARAEFRQFVLDHEDQIVNYLRSCINGSGASWKSTLESAEETFKDDAFKTPESKPGRLESDLEKFTRVLEMSNEESVEVKPTQQIYDLL